MDLPIINIDEDIYFQITMLLKIYIYILIYLLNRANTRLPQKQNKTEKVAFYLAESKTILFKEREICILQNPFQ